MAASSRAAACSYSPAKSQRHRQRRDRFRTLGLSSRPDGSPVYIIEAGVAAQACTRAGERARGRALLDALTPILVHLEPSDWAYNGAMGRAAHDIRDLGALEYASAYHGFAMGPVTEPEAGNWDASSNELSLACRAARLGYLPQVREYYFEPARAFASLPRLAPLPV